MTNSETSLVNTIFSTKMLICVFTGFASGLPLYLLIQLLPAWLASYGVSIKTIGVFTLTQLPYTIKFLWAPAIDSTNPFSLGRRRGWIFITQLILLLTIASLGFLSPKLDIYLIATLSCIIAIFSATQDIALDAFRRELLTENEFGLGNSIHVNAYRLAGLVPGSLSLILSDYYAWKYVFIITALFMIPSILMTLWVKEPHNKMIKKYRLTEIFIRPFQEFTERFGIKMTLYILLFMFAYKLGDSLATSLATPFYLDMGYSRSEIGIIAKNASLWPSIIGALVGGILMIKLGINRALWCFGLVQITAILGFLWLTFEGPFQSIGYYESGLLAAIIAYESLGVGLGSIALIAFIARATNPLYTATQFALFSSIVSIPRSIISATSGYIVNDIGWQNFYIICFLLGIPGMLLLLKVAPWKENKKEAIVHE